MKYSQTESIFGIGTKEREQLSALLANTKIVITVTEATQVLSLDKAQAAKLLAKFNKKGWLMRASQGIYMSVPITSQSKQIIAEEPFAIAEKLFAPCYIGGMNAANYWNLTERLFRTVTVMTQRMLRNRKLDIAGTNYIIHTIKPKYFFGLKTVWLNDIKVKISDPARTVLDMFIFPKFCGGLNFNIEVLQNYYRSEHKNINLLKDYLEKAENGAAIKRLGFLFETFFPEEKEFIKFCRDKLGQGYAKLSPALDCPHLVTHWNLWVPENLKKKSHDC